jgi:hypothetical protein
MRQVLFAHRLEPHPQPPITLNVISSGERLCLQSPEIHILLYEPALSLPEHVSYKNGAVVLSHRSKTTTGRARVWWPPQFLFPTRIQNSKPFINQIGLWCEERLKVQGTHQVGGYTMHGGLLVVEIRFSAVPEGFREGSGRSGSGGVVRGSGSKIQFQLPGEHQIADSQSRRRD